MSITFFEPALERLLESENGPVGQDLRRRAENVKVQAETNASGLIIGIRTRDLLSGIHYEINRDGDGLFATVGTDAQHRNFFYPTFWDRNGRPWLTEALRDGFDA